MVKISNQPNIAGLKKAADDMEYGSKLIARDGKLYGGLLATRLKGLAYGVLIAFVLIVLIPAIALICGL